MNSCNYDFLSPTTTLALPFLFIRDAHAQKKRFTSDLLLLFPHFLRHIFAIFIDQYRPRALALVVPDQRFRSGMLVTEIQEAPPLIKRYLTVIFVDRRLEEVAERIEAFGIDAPAREAHA